MTEGDLLTALRAHLATATLPGDVALVVSIAAPEWWGVGSSPVHLETVCGLTSTEAGEARQRTGGTTWARSSLVIRTAYRLRSPTDRAADAAPALAVQAAIRAHVLNDAWASPGRVSWRSSDRAALTESGWLDLRSTFDLTHPLSL